MSQQAEHVSLFIPGPYAGIVLPNQSTGETMPDNTGKSIYIAGPMRGHPDFNFPAFDAADNRLSERGWITYSPAEFDRSQGFDERGRTGHEPLEELENFDHRESMQAVCEFICMEADAIYMLKGWGHSMGARAEWALALALGLEVIYE